MKEEQNLIADIKKRTRLILSECLTLFGKMKDNDRIEKKHINSETIDKNDVAIEL